MTVVTSPTDLGPMLANIRDFWLGWGGSKRVTAPTALFASGVDHPLFNGVRQSVDGDSWERVRSELAGVPWMWWLGEDSPPGLVESLSADGATEVGVLPVMSVEIARVPSMDPPPGLVLGELTRPEQIDPWVRMWVPNSDLPAEIAPAVSRLDQARSQPDDGEYVRLAGWVDDEIVASAVLLTSHGVAGVYVVSTRESHRRRGIGRAVTAAALEAAAARGLRVAVLNPTDQGEPLYRGMGFRQVSEYRILVPSTS